MKKLTMLLALVFTLGAAAPNQAEAFGIPDFIEKGAKKIKDKVKDGAKKMKKKAKKAADKVKKGGAKVGGMAIGAAGAIKNKIAGGNKDAGAVDMSEWEGDYGNQD